VWFENTIDATVSMTTIMAGFSQRKSVCTSASLGRNIESLLTSRVCATATMQNVQGPGSADRRRSSRAADDRLGTSAFPPPNPELDSRPVMTLPNSGAVTQDDGCMAEQNSRDDDGQKGQPTGSSLAVFGNDLRAVCIKTLLTGADLYTVDGTSVQRFGCTTTLAPPPRLRRRLQLD